MEEGTGRGEGRQTVPRERISGWDTVFSELTSSYMNKVSVHKA